LFGGRCERHRQDGFRWIDQAYADRSSFLLSMNNPAWRALWEDPRFEAIYAKVELPPYQPWKCWSGSTRLFSSSGIREALA
jgi:hypothetical protein